MGEYPFALSCHGFTYGVLIVNKSENCGPGSKPSMLLSPAQLDEFKAEGVLAIPGLVPPAVLDGWQAPIRVACSDGVDLDDPSTWPAGRYAPEGGWPELSPNLYELPSLRSIVEQIGGGAFAPSHPAGQPWTPRVPMTRVILPSAPGTEWSPLSTVTSMGTRQAGAVGSWRSSPCCSGTSAALRAEARPTGQGRIWRTIDTSSSTPSNSTARTSSQSPCGAAGTGRSWRGTPVWARWYV